jgi:hypothetical protein
MTTVADANEEERKGSQFLNARKHNTGGPCVIQSQIARSVEMVYSVWCGDGVDSPCSDRHRLAVGVKSTGKGERGHHSTVQTSSPNSLSFMASRYSIFLSLLSSSGVVGGREGGSNTSYPLSSLKHSINGCPLSAEVASS